MKKYIVIGIVITVLIGIALGFNNHLELQNIVFNSFTWQNLIFNLLLLLILFSLSFVVPVYLFYLLYLLVFLGISLTSFFIGYGILGVVYILLFFIIFKLPLVFFSFLNLFYSLKFSKNLFKLVFSSSQNAKINLKKYTQKLCLMTIIMIIFCIVSFFLGFKVLKVLNYLLF